MASRGPFSKRWQDLRFSDNFIFCQVLKDKEICKKLLERLLHIKIKELVEPVYEKTESPKYDSKSIRYDVYVKEQSGTRIFDLEMQTGNYENLLLRARYYQDVMDVAETPTNIKYEDLKETYIIFICTEDPFKLGSPSYTKKIIFEERPTFPYNDKTHFIVYNASAYKEEKDSEIQAILKFISEEQADTAFTNELKKKVNKTKKESCRGGRNMGYIFESDAIREEAFIETAINMLKDGKLSAEEIAQYTNLPLEKIKQLAAEVLVQTTK